MTFFNNKEQVVKFELTPYGRYLMSVGKLRPHSYEFIDDDVIYDDQIMSGSEIQNETYERIKFETPKIIPNPNKANIQNITYHNVLNDFGCIPKHGFTKHQMAIGKSSGETEKTPAYSMIMLDGQITGTLPVYNGNSQITNTGSFENQFIPQVEYNLNYVLKRRQQSRLVQNSDIRIVSDRFDDGRVLYLQEDNIMTFLKEHGSDYEKENFEIEVFEIDDPEVVSGSYNNPEVLRRLYFESQAQRIENGMIVPAPQQQSIVDENRRNLVFTFFELLVDDEIDPLELCENIKDIKRENLYVDDDLICPQDEAPQRFDIYATRVGPSDLEDCD
jgi:hypothetical protein